MKALFDEVDLRILEQLQDDGRKPFTRIAAEIGVSEATVRARIQRLTRRGVVKFVASVDPHSLGLVYVRLAIRVQGAALTRATEAIAAIPEVIFLDVVSGGFDLMAEVVCRDPADLLRLLSDEIRAVPGVTQVETFHVLRNAKDLWRYSVLADRS